MKRNRDVRVLNRRVESTSAPKSATLTSRSSGVELVNLGHYFRLEACGDLVEHGIRAHGEALVPTPPPRGGGRGVAVVVVKRREVGRKRVSGEGESEWGGV